MVQILPRFDPGGEIGKSIGAGIGSGLEDVTKRKLLRDGIDAIRTEMDTKREAGEQINPLDITLSLMDKVGTLPGGLQALSELAPAIHKEVARSNIAGGQGQRPTREDGQPGGPGNQSKKMPPGSVIEGEEIVTKGRPDEELSSDDYFNAKFQENLQRTQDVEQAAQLTQSQMSARTAEQNRRIQEQQASTNFLDTKIGENFPDGLSAPFKNELSNQYFNKIKTTNPNAAWNELMPKFRKAQLAEENLKTATGSNRPVLFLGDMDQRMDNARTALKDIIDVDPEYAMSLAMNNLDYGPAEAAKLVMPGDQTFNQFTKQVSSAPDISDLRYARGTVGVDTKGHQKDLQKWQNDTQKKLDKFLKEKWNPEKDSLLALRADLYDKGLPEEMFRVSVDKAFPEKNQDKRLSEFNQNEYSKLSEPIIPGMQEIFSLIMSGRFWDTTFDALGKKIRGKR